jgi:hypothetical protein
MLQRMICILAVCVTLSEETLFQDKSCVGVDDTYYDCTGASPIKHVTHEGKCTGPRVGYICLCAQYYPVDVSCDVYVGWYSPAAVYFPTFPTFSDCTFVTGGPFVDSGGKTWWSISRANYPTAKTATHEEGNRTNCAMVSG